MTKPTEKPSEETTREVEEPLEAEVSQEELEHVLGGLATSVNEDCPTGPKIPRP